MFHRSGVRGGDPSLGAAVAPGGQGQADAAEKVWSRAPGGDGNTPGVGRGEVSRLSDLQLLNEV